MPQTLMEVTCDRCGTIFTRRLSNYNWRAKHGSKQYCSYSCKNKSHPKKTNVVARFWSKVKKTDTCWVWTAGTSSNGYGQFHYQGRGLRAHRFSYALQYGEIPEGMDVLHKCDNPPCVRPDHLFAGTNLDNTQDMLAKGRRKGGGRRGEASHFAKLKNADVVAIRERLAKGDRTKDIARDYGVAPTAISSISSGANWAHLQD